MQMWIWGLVVMAVSILLVIVLPTPKPGILRALAQIGCFAGFVAGGVVLVVGSLVA